MQANAGIWRIFACIAQRQMHVSRSYPTMEAAVLTSEHGESSLALVVAGGMDAIHFCQTYGHHKGDESLRTLVTRKNPSARR